MPTMLGPNGEMYIDDAGNLAFGSFDVEAWYSDTLSIQLSASCAIAWSKTANDVSIVTNAYQFDATTWRRRAAGYASRIRIFDNFCTFMHAASGLADADITWLTDMIVESGALIRIGDPPMGTTNGRVHIQTNDADNSASVGGTLHTFQSATGNVGAGEDTLASYTIPAQTLFAPGESIRYEAFGTIANNANAKVLRAYLGADLIAERTLTPSTANHWLIQGNIDYIATLNQNVWARINEGTASQFSYAAISGESLNTDLALTIKGEATANNDIVLRGFKVWWSDERA